VPDESQTTEKLRINSARKAVASGDGAYDRASKAHLVSEEFFLKVYFRCSKNTPPQKNHNSRNDALLVLNATEGFRLIK